MKTSVVVLIVLLIAGGLWLRTRNSTTATSNVPVSTYQENPATSSSSTGSASNPQQGTSTTALSKAVSITGFAFQPNTITIKKGTKVTWTNKDAIPHTVTGTNGGPSSGNLAQGQSYSYTFNASGTFSYYCKIHPNMKGTVVVTE